MTIINITLNDLNNNKTCTCLLEIFTDPDSADSYSPLRYKDPYSCEYIFEVVNNGICYSTKTTLKQLSNFIDCIGIYLNNNKHNITALLVGEMMRISIPKEYTKYVEIFYLYSPNYSETTHTIDGYNYSIEDVHRIPKIANKDIKYHKYVGMKRLLKNSTHDIKYNLCYFTDADNNKQYFAMNEYVNLTGRSRFYKANIKDPWFYINKSIFYNLKVEFALPSAEQDLRPFVIISNTEFYELKYVQLKTT